MININKKQLVDIIHGINNGVQIIQAGHDLLKSKYRNNTDTDGLLIFIQQGIDRVNYIKDDIIKLFK